VSSPAVCQGCGSPLPPPPPSSGRRRKWCSEACRKRDAVRRPVRGLRRWDQRVGGPRAPGAAALPRVRGETGRRALERASGAPPGADRAAVGGGPQRAGDRRADGLGRRTPRSRRSRGSGSSATTSRTAGPRDQLRHPPPPAGGWTRSSRDTSRSLTVGLELARMALAYVAPLSPRPSIRPRAKPTRSGRAGPASPGPPRPSQSRAATKRNAMDLFNTMVCYYATT
jgi:hypothetical protein